MSDEYPERDEDAPPGQIVGVDEEGKEHREDDRSSDQNAGGAEEAPGEEEDEEHDVRRGGEQDPREEDSRSAEGRSESKEDPVDADPEWGEAQSSEESLGLAAAPALPSPLGPRPEGSQQCYSHEPQEDPEQDLFFLGHFGHENLP